MPITYLDEEEEDFASPLRTTPLTQPTRRKITYFDEEPAERKAGLLPPVEEMFKPKPKEVGTFEGIANAARNAFASSQQALAVTGGVTPEEAKEISKIEFEKNARQVSPDYKEYQEAQGFDAVKAFARNPFEVTTNIVAEGLAGSLPALGAGLAAGGVGAAVAAPTVVGAPVGFLAGQVAGTFAGSLATEYGSKVLEELQGAGMDINNPDSITDFFSRQELVDAAKDKALKRGVPIAAFDALSAGIGGKVGAITKAAFKTKPREAVAEMAVQAALGGGGEVVGSLAAGDKVDPKAVFAEVVGEVGPGAAEIGVGKIQQTFAERRKQEQIKRAAKVSQDLENNNAPLTADALKTTVAKNAVEEERATIEETDAALAEAAERPTVPIREEEPYVQPPKEEFKAAFARMTPESIAETEANFREQLQSEDEETRVFSQNALDALAEFRAEQARARKLPTDVLPTETPGATYGREADIYDVFADIRRKPMPPSGPAFESAQVIEEAARRADVLRRTPEGRDLLRRELQGEEMVSGVRRATEEALATAPEPAEGDVFAEIRRPSRAEEAAITIEQQLTEDERIRRSQLGAEALREELAQVESLSRVADNTATDEEVVRLARQGLVNIQDGQNVITPRGEEVMQRGGAPLPRLTPEERAAEVAAAPTPTVIVEQAPTPTPAPTPVTTPPVTEAVIPAPAAPAEAAAELAGISVGNKIKVKGDNFTKYVVSEVLPQTDFEVRNNERSYILKNEKTGEVIPRPFTEQDFDKVGGKKFRKMAVTPTKITPQTPEETTAFQKASSNKVMARNPELAVAAVRLKNGEITAGEYADLIDSIDPFTVKGAESIPTKDKIDQYIGEDKRSKVNAPIQSGKEVEFRIDIPTYNRSTAAGDTVYAVTAHEPVPETSTRVGTPISYLGAAKVINPKMMTRSISGKGEAIDIATGAVKFPLATVKGNYEPITNLPADINNPDVWTEVSYNPIRSSYFVDVRSNNAVVGGDEAIMVGSRVFVKNPQMQARPRGIVGGAGIRDIRYMASELRAEEKYTPVPEADRYTFREASGRAIRFFGGEKPENFVIVNNTDDPDYEFKAGYDPDSGEIILNRAYIQSGENIEDILTHELGHYIYSDPQFQADFQSFLESMPDEARAEIDRIVNEGYNKETNEVQIEEREVMAFASLIRRTKRGLTAWEKLKDTIKKIINRLLKTNIMLSDRGAMAVFNVGYKRFNSGERIIREMKKGTLRTAPEGMTQMDRDYLAAVERGDMETAQRMVDEAAETAGYSRSNAFDYDTDNYSPWFHGSPEGGITVFKNRFDEYYFSNDRDTANSFGDAVYESYLKMSNPLIADAFGGDKYSVTFEGEKMSVDDFVQIAKTKGHDSAVIENVVDSVGGVTDPSTIVAVFNPTQIKSADPVTYDDAGDVIPLSQRFRPTSPDIRRMAPEPTPAPEAVVEEAPAERPKRRTKMQNIIDISTGVKRPKTKLTVNEMTALKDQIKIGARKRREDKRTQREFAKDLTQQLREAAIRGKVRPSQLRAITSKALQTQFDNEASILGFVNYANKVIENANYEKDLSDAKSAIKSAKRLAKQKGLAGNIKANLEKLANIDPRQIEPEEMVEVDGEAPISVAEFTAVLKEYMKAGGPVTAEEYVLVPDAEITDFLTKLGEQIETNRKATENLGMDGELAAIADKTPEEIDAELARDEERRNRIEQKINGLAEEAQVALVNYDNPEITSEEKIVLDDMKRITLSDISIGERKEFIKIANNILVNNKFLGAQKFASMARGQIGAVEAAKDSKTVNRNSATLKFYENLLGENFGRLVNLGTQSFADTFRNLTGTQGLPRLLYQMGFGEIERGQANTNRARREITDGVQQRFKQIEKETGQRIAETQGVYSMGVAGNLIQIHPDETEAEGIQRMRGLIEKDIEKKKKSPKTEDRKTALYVEKALGEVYADSIQGILDNLNRLHPANYKALTFLMNEVLPEYKPLLKEHDELFNNQTENYENPYYLPIRYRSIGTEPKKPGELRGRASDSVTAPKQAPNSIKRIKNSVLPEGKQFDYNLTRNVLDSLSTQLEAAYTNPGWQQVYAFLKSPEAVEALGGVENYDFVTKRINNLSDSRERKIYQMDPFNQAADFVANMVRKIGTSIALGGIGQAAKQMPDQVATTIANVNDLSITTPAFTEIKAALPAMRQFSIGERGEIAGGSKWVNQLEGNFTKLQQFMQDGLWPKAMEAFENLNNFWLIPLKISDTVAASHGWISYYKKYLKDNDIQFTNWDNESELIAKGDRSRVEAGLYADQMIDIYQGSSDPTKMATFAQRGDSGGGNLLKTMIMPFSSFVIQQRSRILSDLRDISYGDTDEKKVAAKGLAGTLLGIVIFHGVRRYALPFLTGGVAAAAYGLLGVDMEEPDEEERLEKERRVFRQFLGEVASNIFVGGYSAYAETRLIDAVNAAAYFYEIQTQSENVLDDKGEIMSWEKYRKERAPMYRYTGPGADSTLGMLDILPSQARESFDRLKDLSDDEIMDSLTEEEQRVLILAALSETLYTMRLNDADVARMVKRMAKDVKDQAEARQKAERQLQRIYGQ